MNHSAISHWLTSLWVDVLEYLNISKLAWDARYVLEFVLAIAIGVRGSADDIEILRRFWACLAAIYQELDLKASWEWSKPPPADCWPERLRYGAFRTCVFNHKLFITESGHVGSGTRYMKQGDHVYVLYGGAPLYILRPQDKPQEYTYIGGAYMEGYMRGKAIKFCDEGVLKEQRITLT